MPVLKNKTAIITGAGGGIGMVIAEAMLKEGAKVVLASRSGSRLETIAAQLSGLGDVLAVHTDVSDLDQVQNLAAETCRKFGKIDILVNAAGLQQPIGPFIETDLGEWIKNINVNLIGTVACCKAVLPGMIQQKRGKIINFSGGGATGPRPNFSAYAVSKAAIVRFTETLAAEVASDGVDVNAIAPGAVASGMIREIINAGQKAGPQELASAGIIIQQGGTDPQLPAGLVVFLASDKSDGFSGRLVSSVWDDWRTFDGQMMKKIADSSLYTLRRIDGKNFVEVTGK